MCGAKMDRPQQRLQPHPVRAVGRSPAITGSTKDLRVHGSFLRTKGVSPSMSPKLKWGIHLGIADDSQGMALCRICTVKTKDHPCQSRKLL